MNYPVQKALHYNEAKAKKNFQLGTYAIMEKLDGWFIFADCIGGKWGNLKSRAEREIPSIAYLNDKIAKALPSDRNVRVIFEATIPNMQFHELNGVLNRKYEDAENVVLNLHDVVWLDEPEIPFTARWKAIDIFFMYLTEFLGKQVQQVPILAVTSDEETIYKHFTAVLDNGGEGIILKNCNSGYFFGKRNAHLMKIKAEVSKDLAVIGMVEGEGKYVGTLGALIVQSRDGTKHTISGMTDTQRTTWWNARSLIIGQVVEVKAMQELPDGSLREARFKCVRFDKTLAEID